MTPEQILELAKQCGGVSDDLTIVLYHTELITFANAIAQRTRDECAEVAFEFWCSQSDPSEESAAQAIRSMK